MTVTSERRGHAGIITLDKPKTLNALDHEMILAIDAALTLFERDAAVRHVVIRSTSPKAFSAGGDIRTIVEDIRAGRFDAVEAFYWDEYRLNARIKHYPKPYIALIGGIVMGGGVGVSIHGSHRVASEGIVFAMPEVGIGLFPDVGGTWFLPRMPGRIGTWLALTGERIRAADALHAGVATHHVPAAAIDGLVDRLARDSDVDAVLAAAHVDPGPAPLAALGAEIDALFAGETLAGVFERLAAAPTAFAAATLRTLASRSPTSLSIAWRQMREGPMLGFDNAMRLEWRIVHRVIRGHDFAEGVRAVIFDKDNAPRWSPATLADIDPHAIDSHVSPHPVRELDLSR